MEQIIALKVSELRTGTNYRMSGDKAKQDELNASVKERGVLTPLWVRVVPGGYHIIAGERRHKAAKAAGLETVPAIIKEATDAQALELSVIENDQREDVNPMEQAMGYKRLLDEGKHTPETLAAKLSRKVPYVQGLLRLLAIPKEAQQALLDGKIQYGHALLLTRLKNNGDQKAFFKSIMAGEDWGSNEPMTVKQAQNALDEFTLRLKSAAFDVQLCATCAFRSRAQAGLFPEEAKADDKCMDASCFFLKTREHYRKLAVIWKEKGIKVLETAAEVQTAKRSPNARELETEPGRWDHPKKYKSMCVPCPMRTLYCYEEKQHGERSSFHIGEICLNKKCYNKMQGHPEERSSSGSSRPASKSRAAEVHALGMRDRFLRTRMPAKVEANEILQRRLVLFHLLCRFDRFSTALKPEIKKDQDQTLAEILREHCPAWKHESLLDEQKLFAAVSMIPAVSLAAVTRKAILASVAFTEEEVLLQGMGEAGLSFEKDFQVDEAFLVTKTKGELAQLVRDFKIQSAGSPIIKADIVNMKKPEIVKLVLAQKLTGKVPSEVAKECKLVSFGGAKVKAKKKGKA